MEHVCPDIGMLATCYSCSDHWLPPYRLCVVGHVACNPCANHRVRCECGQRFATGPHSSYDWLMSAMKHRCKYRVKALWQNLSMGGDADDSCPLDVWYTVQQLRDHYRNSCSRNKFVCPIAGCRHTSRIDTIVEHYESVHGPFESGERDMIQPNLTYVSVPYNSEVIKKAFNGYFSFSSGSPTSPERPLIQVGIKNINPADLLNYKYSVKESTTYSNEVIVVVAI